MAVTAGGPQGQDYCGEWTCGVLEGSCPSYGIGGNCDCPGNGGTCQFVPSNVRRDSDRKIRDTQNYGDFAGTRFANFTNHPCQSGGECQCGGKCKQNGYLNAPGKWYYDNMANDSKVRVTSEVRKPLPKTNKTPWVMTKAEIETFNNSAYGQHLAALNTPTVTTTTPTTTTAGFMGIPNLVWIAIGVGAIYYGHQKGMFKKILK